MEEEREEVIIQNRNIISIEGLLKKTHSLSLSSLDVSQMGIEEIPPALYNLEQLEHLYMEGNKIAFLPEAFFHALPKLMWLDLRNNSLTEIPCAVQLLTQLSTLLLEGNALKKLPVEIGLLPKLNGLSLKGNPLQYPPTEVVEKGIKEIQKFCLKELGCQKRFIESEDESEKEDEPLDLVSNQYKHHGRHSFSLPVNPRTSPATSKDCGTSPSLEDMIDLPTYMPRTSISAMYGAVLGENPMANSYFFKPWNTGSYLTRPKKGSADTPTASTPPESMQTVEPFHDQ